MGAKLEYIKSNPWRSIGKGKALGRTSAEAGWHATVIGVGWLSHFFHGNFIPELGKRANGGGNRNPFHL
jgi:hypothetical protein